MKKICFVVSDPLTARAFLADQITELGRSYEVGLAANVDGRSMDWARGLGISKRIFAIPIERKISPLRDALALILLIRLFRRHRFDAVHSVSPKAGLLAMLAGILARVPVRTHTFTGQVWATRSGMGRALLKAADKIIAGLATSIIVDSPSQRRFLIEEKVLSEEKSRVFCHGSISGVDAVRFRPDPEARAEVRSLLGIPEDAPVFLFLGRLNRDKGVADLARAFAHLAAENGKARLLLVGPDEENLRPGIRGLCASCGDRVHFVDFAAAPEKYMASADVFCLPSYREGFGSVLIEAAAAGVAAVASRIYGITDAVDDGETGLLYNAGDVGQLTDRMRTLLNDPGLREKMGASARRRAQKVFPKEKLTAAMLEYYRTTVK